MSLAHSHNLAQLRLQCRNRRGDAKGERAREREEAEKRARGSDAPQGALPFEVTGVFYVFTAV